MIAGDDPAPWRLLADGTVIGVERVEDVVAITVELHALHVRVLLAGCDAVKYQPHDEPMLYELDVIAASEPDIRDAAFDGRTMCVTGGAGTLHLAYANLALEISGTPVELGELARRLAR